MSNKDSIITKISIYRLDLPLIKPYKLSYNTFHSFEPLLIHIIDNAGNEGWGEQHISPGSSNETRDGGWTFARILSKLILNKTFNEAKEIILSHSHVSIVASSALHTAIEMLTNPSILSGKDPIKMKLLTAFNAEEEIEIRDELDKVTEQGFTTIKIKVGRNVSLDLKKIDAIQKNLNGRANLRIDANRAYTKVEGCKFVTGLEPNFIELFEQPCDADDWEANAAVAKMSSVPIMLDEPICSMQDIQKASRIDGVSLCKLKLKRFVSISKLTESINYAHSLGLEIVIGDGLGSEINCWMEAKIASGLIENAGEYNGFLKIKPEARILSNPIKFQNGFLETEDNWKLQIDRDKLEKYSIYKEVIYK
jgi:L-alanine-DL-glutamate epimerase-like enolase superfamily enzyme|tara:strand:+ start:75 stop:1169 length:1095 start_codon:yes stop_codon:yes gene_type:complete